MQAAYCCLQTITDTSMEKQVKKVETKNMILMLFVSMTSGLLITLFLKGKIIDISQGTHERGLMGAAGVAVILAFMAIIIFAIAKFSKARA